MFQKLMAGVGEQVDLGGPCDGRDMDENLIAHVIKGQMKSMRCSVRHD